MKSTVLLITLLLFAEIIFAQAKKPLTHSDILKWERITETVISNDGKIIVYKQEPWKGDPSLKITTPKGDEITSVKCGTDAKITFDSKFVVFTLKPAEDSIRQLKLKKTKKEDLPINELAIFNLETQKTDTIEKLISVKVPEKWAGWIAWQTEAPKDTLKKNAEVKAKAGDEKVYPLFVKNLKTGVINEFPAVSNYLFAEEKEVLVFISEGKDSAFDAGIYCYDLANGKNSKIKSGKGKYKQLTVNKPGDKVAFLNNVAKKESRESDFNVNIWDGGDSAKVVAAESNTVLPENWEISENGQLSFSENGNRVFFGTAPKKAPKDTTVLDEEIPVLDVWTWNEEQLQTVQLNNKSRDAKKSYLAVYHLDSEKTVQLETTQFTGIRQIKNGDSDVLFAWSNRPYAVQTMWEGSPEHNDFYLIDANTGVSRMIKKDCRATPQVSPEGKYLYWYNAIDTSWYSFNIEKEKEFKITSPNNIQVADELNDIPNLPGSYRTAGWLEKDESVLVYDRFDIWKVNPENLSEPINLTKNGRSKNISYRLIRFDEESGSRRFGQGEEKGIDPAKPFLLAGHNDITRADGYYSLELNKKSEPKELYSGNFSLNRPQKAKNTDLIIFAKEDFLTYPDLLSTDFSFKKQVQISNAAPQQNDFLWGTAELVSWTSLDGRKLEGTLHKPENFDPTKKYQMIVNFYEKSSQELFSYRMPELLSGCAVCKNRRGCSITTKPTTGR